MDKEHIFAQISLAFAIIIMAAHPAFAKFDDPDIEMALKNYRNSHYRTALRFFEAAEKKHLDEKTAEFVRSSIKSMEELRHYFYEVEKDEFKLRQKKDDPAFRSLVSGEHRRLGLLLTQRRFYMATAEPQFKRAAILAPSDPQVCFDLANLYYAGMQYGKAVDNYKIAIKLDPKNAAAYKLAGDASVAIGDFDAAKKFYSETLNVNNKAIYRFTNAELDRIRQVIKTLPETYKDISGLIKEGNDEEAEVLLKKRLSLNPADYIAITELGSIYEDRGDRKLAVKMYKSAIKAAPDYPVAHLLLGRTYFTMRKYDNAVKELRLFKEKMRLLPGMDKDTREMYINSLYYLAEVYYTLRKYRSYKAEIDEILALDPEQQDANYSLGIYYYMCEHSRSKAYNAFKKVIDIDPNTNAARAAENAIEFMRSNPDPRFSPSLAFPERR